MRVRSIFWVGWLLVLTVALGFLLKSRVDRARVSRELEVAQERETIAREAFTYVQQKTALAKSTAAPMEIKAEPRHRFPTMWDLQKYEPDLLHATLQQYKANTMKRYTALISRLNLSAESTQRWQDLWSERFQQMEDLWKAAKSLQLEDHDPDVEAQYAELRAASEAKIRELLGADAFREFQDITRSFQVQGFVDGFAVQMAGTNPLSPQTANRLNQAVRAASLAFQAGEDADPGDIDWEKVDAMAAGILSPSQLTVWTTGIVSNGFGSRARLELQKLVDRERAADEARDVAKEN